MNNANPNIKFTFEGETNNALSFLDITVRRINNKFETSVFRKKTFTGLSTNYFSSIFYKYKATSIHTLLHRAFRVCSSYQSFHLEVEFLRTYFIQNFYPADYFNSLLKRFLNSRYSHGPSYDVSKQPVYIKLPFIGEQTSKLLIELRTLLSLYFPQVNPLFCFTHNHTIGSYFKKCQSHMRPPVVYNNRRPHLFKKAFNCSSVIGCDCSQQYIGSTKLQLFRRVSQHRGVSFRTGRPLAKPDNSAIRDHCNHLNHVFNAENFTVIDTCRNSHDLRILESLCIFSEHPSLKSDKCAIIRI